MEENISLWKTSLLMCSLNVWWQWQHYLCQKKGGSYMNMVYLQIAVLVTWNVFLELEIVYTMVCIHNSNEVCDHLSLSWGDREDDCLSAGLGLGFCMSWLHHHDSHKDKHKGDECSSSKARNDDGIFSCRKVVVNKVICVHKWCDDHPECIVGKEGGAE